MSESLSKNYEVVPFWFNPNIETKKEHDKRLKYFKQFCNVKSFFQITVDKYQADNDAWHKYISGLEIEPEGGARCEKCIKFRLEKTAMYAKENGFSIFGTTLTVSPHKNAKMINKIGQELSEKFGVVFLAADFKKNDGYARSVKISKELAIYRQNYCGCEYSLNNKLYIKNNRRACF